MSDWIIVISGTAYLLGFITGQMLSFKRVRKGGKTLLIPGLEKHPLQSRGLSLVLVVLFLMATAQLTFFTLQQRQCNAEFKRVQVERAQINDEDTSIRLGFDDAFVRLVDKVFAVPEGAPGRQEIKDQAKAEYNRELAALYKRQDAVAIDRDAKRYPPARC